MSTKKLILSIVIAAFVFCGGCFSPKGGFNMELTLEVPVSGILKNLSNNNNDTTFLKALALTEERQKQSTAGFIQLFGNAWQEVDPNAGLSTIFNTFELKDKVTFSSTNDEVLKVLKDETDNAIKLTSEVLMNRLIGYGISEKTRAMDITDNKIHLKISGIHNPDRIKKLLTEPGRLELWETYENGDVISYLAQANDYLKANTDAVIAAPAETPAAEGETVEQSLIDEINSEGSSDREEFAAENPLFGILMPNINPEGEPLKGSQVGYALAGDTTRINSYLKMIQIRSLFPRDLKFLWSRNPYEFSDPQPLYELHAIKVTSRDGQPPINGRVITSAKATKGSGDSDARILFTMNAEGADIWSRMTRDNIDRCIAVVIDGFVESSPRVMTEITGGKTEISGNFTIEEATDLANVFSSGELPYEVQIVQEETVKSE
jgi:SecD/SecF fusion protein